jgi:phage FluMu protein Com
MTHANPNAVTHEVRCKGCSSLLGKVDESGLTIRRGELQATMVGDFHASLVCYRPRCRALNVLTLSTRAPERVA